MVTRPWITPSTRSSSCCSPSLRLISSTIPSYLKPTTSSWSVSPRTTWPSSPPWSLRSVESGGSSRELFSCWNVVKVFLYILASISEGLQALGGNLNYFTGSRNQAKPSVQTSHPAFFVLIFTQRLRDV